MQVLQSSAMVQQPYCLAGHHAATVHTTNASPSRNNPTAIKTVPLPAALRCTSRHHTAVAAPLL